MAKADSEDPAFDEIAPDWHRGRSTSKIDSDAQIASDEHWWGKSSAFARNSGGHEGARLQGRVRSHSR